MYESLAEWWPLLSAPGEYEEEAGVFTKYLLQFGDRPAETLLELGSGGGNNASYMKRNFRLTLVDLSPGMLAHSRVLNPECEHHVGDMRSARLERQFDRVFVHDAICYMTTYEDLRRAIETAFVHCRPGGAVLFAPDAVRETFEPGTIHGGNDSETRSMRFLEWVWDPDPSDSIYFADYVYVLRDERGDLRTEHDRHVEGLFSRSEWVTLLETVGFEPHVVPFTHSELEAAPDLFIGVRPGC